MKQILHIIASPRGMNSDSTKLANNYLKSLSDIEVDTLNLWQEPLIEFDGDKAAAKGTFFGFGEMTNTLQTHWDKVVEVIDRFKGADEYVISVPMWNGSIPYKLKQYIDVITQPHFTYKFHPDTGYSGLLENKSARLFFTSGVYGLNTPPSWGEDYHSTYLKWWLNMIGITDIKEVRFQPSAVTANPKEEFSIALEKAKNLSK
ncbi:FMN-dependent NADH-azoreductase [Maribacter litoralis]|uniref:FMN dependent NADH:quinone oxidoreductase n=1 Tax=Maribacter litoralis TaxID=2059726 RepID=A0A653XD58_9FLAO|nr:NAD(P)H-dependent oxidoreductase [Maribacter litoralis]VXC27993.1 FMN-dependent NADH-azoreductase [Maribacter litoralis]